MRSLIWFLLIFAISFLNASSVSADNANPLVIGRGSVISAAWSPDGTRILVNTVLGAWIYDDRLRDVAHLPLYRAAYSPDGKYLAGLDDERRAIVLDTTAFEAVAMLTYENVRVNALAWHPDSQRLAVATEEPSFGMIVWEFAVESVPAWRTTSLLRTDALYWNPGGTRLVALASHDQFIHVWHVQPGSPNYHSEVVSLARPYESPGVMFWLDDDRFFAGPQEENLIFKLYDATTGQTVYDETTFPAYTLPDVSPDGQQIAVPFFQFVRVVQVADLLSAWRESLDRDTLVVETYVGGYWRIRDVRWSPDGSQFAVSAYLEGAPYSDDGEIWTVDVITGTKRVIRKTNGNDIRQIIWQPGGARLLAVGANGTLTIIGEQVITRSNASADDFRPAVAWSPDSQHFAVGDTLNSLEVWDVSTHVVAHTYVNSDEHSKPFLNVVWNPSGRYLAASNSRGNGSFDTRVWIYDSESETSDPFSIIQPQLPGRIGVIREMAWHPSNEELLLIDGGHSIPIYTLGETTPSRTISAGGSCDCRNIYSAIWNAEGTRLMLSYDVLPQFGDPNVTVIWDDESRRTTDDMLLVDWTLPRVWTPDDRAVGIAAPVGASINVQGEVALQQLMSDGTLTTITLPRPSGIFSRTFLSPDGLRGAVITEEGNGLIYDIEQGRIVVSLGETVTMAWSVDGQRSAMLRHDGSIWLADRDGRVTSVLADAPALRADDFLKNTPRQALYWSPDGARLAVVYGGVVWIYTI